MWLVFKVKGVVTGSLSLSPCKLYGLGRQDQMGREGKGRVGGD